MTVMREVSGRLVAATATDESRKALRMLNMVASPVTVPLAITPPVSLDAWRINSRTPCMRVWPLTDSDSASSIMTGIASTRTF